MFQLLTSTCSPSIFPHSDSSSMTESTHTLHSFSKLSLHALYHFYLFLSSALFLHLSSTSTLFLPYSHSYSLCCKWKPVFRNSLTTAFTHFHSIYHMNFDWDSQDLRKLKGIFWENETWLCQIIVVRQVRKDWSDDFHDYWVLWQISDIERCWHRDP